MATKAPKPPTIAADSPNPGMTRAEAEILLRDMARSFDVDLSDAANIDHFEHVDPDTGRGLKVHGGTIFIRAYRENGQACWLPKDQWKENYQDKKVIENPRQRHKRVLTGRPLFTPEPPPGRLQAIMEKQAPCPVCGKLMDAKSRRYRFAGTTTSLLTALNHHTLSRHPKSDEAMEIRDGLDIETDARQARIMASALREALQPAGGD